MFSFRNSILLLLCFFLLLNACGGGNSTAPEVTTTPDTFSFKDQSGVEVNTIITSNDITVTGINAPAEISITDGEYSVDNGAYRSTAGTVKSGQAVSVRQTSSPNFMTTTNTTLTIGGFADTFSVTTRAVNTTPKAFNFTNQSDVTLNTVVTSNHITVSGIDTTVEISISDGEYSIENGTFTNVTGSVSSGQVVAVRHTSSSMPNTTNSSLLNIGSVNGTFISTTGPIGTRFNKARGFDNSVLTISPANDGSGDVYMGGSFSTYNGSTSDKIIRLNSDGSADPAFNVGNGFDGYVHVITPAVDGSGDIYVGGGFHTYNGSSSNYLIRLNSDGSMDTEFNVGTAASGTVYSISPVTDGSGHIYVGGEFDYRESMIRLNSDGSLDLTFDMQHLFSRAEMFREVHSINSAIDGSNKVYVGGKSRDHTGLVNRLNSDGSVDSTFNVGTAFNKLVNIITPIPNGGGGVYVGGAFSNYNGTDANAVIRLNSDGSVDTTFNIGTGFNGGVTDIIPTTDGTSDVYVGGNFSTYNGISSNGVIRLNIDGTVDTLFDEGAGFDSAYIYGVKPIFDGSGDVYVGGDFSSYNGVGCNNALRMNSGGSLDAAFSVGSGFDNNVAIIAPAADNSGDIYVGGAFRTYNGKSSSAIIRLNSYGSVDTEFNVGTGFNSPRTVNSIKAATDNSGDLYVAGTFDSYNGVGGFRLVRLNSDGSIDTDFNAGWRENSGIVYAISPATDGSGRLYVASSGSNPLRRLNSDGSTDTTFNTGSSFTSSYGVHLRSISPTYDSSGGVYIGGDFNTYNGTGSNGIIRLNSDGSVDTTFNVGTGFNREVLNIFVAEDGSNDVYVGGKFTSYNGSISNHIIRLNSDGSEDTEFSVGTGFDSSVYSISPVTDGSGDIYVGGAFNSYNGTISNGMIRLKEDGSVNTTFNIGTSFNGIIRSLCPTAESNGGVYAGGEFTIFQSTLVERIVLLNPAGSLK